MRALAGTLRGGFLWGCGAGQVVPAGGYARLVPGLTLGQAQQVIGDPGLPAPARAGQAHRWQNPDGSFAQGTFFAGRAVDFDEDGLMAGKVRKPGKMQKARRR